MPFYTLTSCLGEPLEVELAEDELEAENIKAIIKTWEHYADGDRSHLCVRRGIGTAN